MKTPSGCCEPWSAGHAPRIYSTMIPNVTSSSSTNPPDLAFAEGFGGHEVFFVQVANWFAGVVADLLEDFNDLQLVRPGLRQRAGLVGPHLLVAVTHSLFAALGLQVARELGDGAHQLSPHLRHHVPDLPLRSRAQTQVGDVQQLGEVDHDLEVRRRGVGEHEARVLGRNAGGDGLSVDAGDLVHQLLEAVGLAVVLPRIGHDVFEALFILAGEAHVALRLLLEGDADPVAHELVAERAADARDAEPEDHLLERRDVAGLQPIVDELGDLLARDGARGDVVPDLARGLRCVASAIRAVELDDRLAGHVDEHHIHAVFVPCFRGPDMGLPTCFTTAHARTCAWTLPGWSRCGRKRRSSRSSSTWTERAIDGNSPQDQTLPLLTLGEPEGHFQATLHDLQSGHELQRLSDNLERTLGDWFKMRLVK